MSSLHLQVNVNIFKREIFTSDTQQLSEGTNSLIELVDFRISAKKSLIVIIIVNLTDVIIY